MGYMKYTKDEIIESIERFINENGRVPKYDEFNKKNGYPSHFTVQRHFGSWNNAIKEAGFDVNKMNNLTRDELLDYLRKYEREYGRPPIARDLNNTKNNPEYPSIGQYNKQFGNLERAKKLVGQDMDSRAKKGISDHPKQKARLAEIFVMEHFKEEGAIDLAGENCMSPVDGICPKKQIYDVKSSALRYRLYWQFALDKGDSVDFYYLLAFNEDYSELKYVWRIPWNFTNNISLHVNEDYITKMEKYNITAKFEDVFNKWEKSLNK